MVAIDFEGMEVKDQKRYFKLTRKAQIKAHNVEQKQKFG
jgi:hypothetical protein